MVVTLQEALKSESLEDVEDAISRFKCLDKDVETFLKTKAIDFERRDKSRTYLVFDDDALLGYFTLSLNALPFRQEVSNNMIKRIDGFSKDVKAVGIILIGQFGKDSERAGTFKGSELLNLCMQKIRIAKGILGGRFVMLECLEIPQVVSFYEKNGFAVLQKDEKDKYLQMIRRLQ